MAGQNPAPVVVSCPACGSRREIAPLHGDWEGALNAFLMAHQVHGPEAAVRAFGHGVVESLLESPGTTHQ